MEFDLTCKVCCFQVTYKMWSLIWPVRCVVFRQPVPMYRLQNYHRWLQTLHSGELCPTKCQVLDNATLHNLSFLALCTVSIFTPTFTFKNEQNGDSRIRVKGNIEEIDQRWIWAQWGFPGRLGTTLHSPEVIKRLICSDWLSRRVAAWVRTAVWTVLPTATTIWSTASMDTQR